MTERSGRVLLRSALAIVLAASAGHTLPARAEPSGPTKEVREQIRFGVEMAQKGNWREAVFRWKRALEGDPQNPRLLNNLAVGYETLGDFEQAEQSYTRALTYAPQNREIRQNYAMFHAFYDRYKTQGTEPKPADSRTEEPAAAGGKVEPE